MRGDSARLADILERISRIIEHAAPARSRTADSAWTLDAVVRSLEAIGGSARALASPLRKSHPGVAWRAMLVSGFSPPTSTGRSGRSEHGRSYGGSLDFGGGWLASKRWSNRFGAAKLPRGGGSQTARLGSSGLSPRQVESGGIQHAICSRA